MAFMFLRVKHMKHKIYMIGVIVLLLLVYVTASQVLSTYNLNWKSSQDLITGVKVYFSWVLGVGENFKNIGGNVIKMDWKLKNQTSEEF